MYQCQSHNTDALRDVYVVILVVDGRTEFALACKTEPEAVQAAKNLFFAENVDLETDDLQIFFHGDPLLSRETVESWRSFLKNEWCKCDDSEFYVFMEDDCCSCGNGTHHVHCRCGSVMQIG
jgi:hypothetical protein